MPVLSSCERMRQQLRSSVRDAWASSVHHRAVISRLLSHQLLSRLWSLSVLTQAQAAKDTVAGAATGAADTVRYAAGATAGVASNTVSRPSNATHNTTLFRDLLLGRHSLALTTASRLA